jgi:hypothetical protein
MHAALFLFPFIILYSFFAKNSKKKVTKNKSMMIVDIYGSP